MYTLTELLLFLLVTSIVIGKRSREAEVRNCENHGMIELNNIMSGKPTKQTMKTSKKIPEVASW